VALAKSKIGNHSSSNVRCHVLLHSLTIDERMRSGRARRRHGQALARAHRVFKRAALEKPTAREVVEALLFGVADLATGAGTPAGCLGVNGALACSPAGEDIQKELAARRTHLEAALRKRLERARREGDLPEDASPADLASFNTTVSDGISVKVKFGASRQALRCVAEMALRVWPG
jgi:hypothetical protein